MRDERAAGIGEMMARQRVLTRPLGRRDNRVRCFITISIAIIIVVVCHRRRLDWRDCNFIVFDWLFLSR